MEAWPLNLAPARPSDAESIAVISRVRIEHGLSWRWTADRVRRAMRDPNTEVVVARADRAEAAEALVGFGILQFVEAVRAEVALEEAHLLLLGVAEPWSRRGVGRRVLRFLEEEARMAGVGRVMLEVRASNQGARAFYRALGYREVARLGGYYQGLEDAVRMMSRLELNQNR